MSMTEALGTSMPTSMTVVETRTWISPALNRRMIASLSSNDSRPCRSPTTRSGNTSACSVRAMSVAALRSISSDSSMSGYTT